MSALAGLAAAPAPAPARQLAASSRRLASPAAGLSCRRGLPYSAARLSGSRSRAPPRWRPLNVVAKSNNERVLDLAIRVGKEGLNGATKLVPASIPRPIATAGVAVVGLFLVSSILRTVFSTFFFIALLGGAGYLGFLYFTQGSGNSTEDSDSSSGDGGSGSGNALDDARRIMDKYK
eukprot:SM000011S19139  [mRNA]  locus=s11:1009983:1011043:- [translate_table: standard]